jgi:hypothetical protein
MSYEFRTRVDGIPCICRVTWYTPADDTPVSSTTISPPDEEMFEFELLDRKGKPASWLNKKINSEIEAELLSQYKEIAREI